MFRSRLNVFPLTSHPQTMENKQNKMKKLLLFMGTALIICMLLSMVIPQGNIVLTPGASEFNRFMAELPPPIMVMFCFLTIGISCFVTYKLARWYSKLLGI